MAIEFGRQAYIAIGEETIWGTSVATTVENRVNSVSLSRSQERTRKSHLSSSSAAFQIDSYDGMESAGGSIELPVHYEGSGLLLKASLGSVASTGVGPYVHTYTPTLTIPSLTINNQRGSGKSEKFLGCKVATMSLSCEAGGELMGTWEIIAKTADTRSAALPSPTFGDGKEVVHHQAGLLTFNSLTYSIRSFNLTLSNSQERRNNLGSKLTAEPQLSDIRSVELSVEADLDGDALYNSQLVGDVSDVFITFTNSDSDSFEIRLRSAYLREYSDDVNTFGVLTRSMVWVGQGVSPNEAMEIKITNQDPTGIAN
tara:strand:+ start:577 stop:1515 length:939 start_codon:yes stop_codon:yes gene_type:complete